MTHRPVAEVFEFDMELPVVVRVRVTQVHNPPIDQYETSVEDIQLYLGKGKTVSILNGLRAMLSREEWHDLHDRLEESASEEYSNA